MLFRSLQRGVSRRAVGIGLLCCTAISLGESYGVLVVRGSAMAADYSTGAALVLFFLLTLILNPLARLLTGSQLHSRELATVYIMMIVAAAIPSWGFVMNLIPFLGGLFYYATPENDWANIIHPHVADWLVAQDRAAIRKLFEGASQGERVPWSLWLQPLRAWFFFVLSIYFATLCILVMLRKQWMENERLLFPLATLPIELGRQESGKWLPPLLRSYLTWIGFALPFVVYGINGLHSYFSFFPFVELNTYVRFLRNAIGLNLRPRFEVIGLSYLLSLDVSFGVWFFAFAAILHSGVERMLGWSIGPGQPYSLPATASVAHLAQGAMFFLVFSSLWSARRHLAPSSEFSPCIQFRETGNRRANPLDDGPLVQHRGSTNAPMDLIRARCTVSDHDVAVYPEERCARQQMGRPQHLTGWVDRPVGGSHRTHGPPQGSFHRLECDIAGEAVDDDDIGSRLRHQVVALDRAHVLRRKLFGETRVGLLAQVIALASFAADAQQTDTRRINADNPCVGRTNGCEADEIFRSCVRRGATIEQDHRPMGRR